jgi:hypothetical protein
VKKQLHSNHFPVNRMEDDQNKDEQNEDEQNKDFLLQRRPVTRVQLIGLLISTLAFLGFGLGIEGVIISTFRQAPGALSIVVLVFGSLICLLFLRLAWLSLKRIFAAPADRPDKPL